MNGLPPATQKRRQNEKKFGNWMEISGGGRCDWYEVQGRSRWNARYVKEVDAMESTLRFYQQIMMDPGNFARFITNIPSTMATKG